MVTENLDNDLRDRDAIYGKFSDSAQIAQRLKETLRSACQWDQLTAPQKEALDMIMAKCARIVNGKCRQQRDSWYDIAGYAKLGSGEFD